jgi:colanic acid/amylovoran biosynthesis glycosyltransferase
MKLMIFSESFGELTTTFVRNELDYFLHRGIKIQYIAINNGPVEYTNENFKLKILNLKEFKFISFLRIKMKLNFINLFNYNFKFSRKLNLLIDEFKPEALYFHFFNEFLLYYDNLSSKNKKVPITVHFHGYDASRLLVFKSYISRIRELNGKNNIKFVFVSKDMKIRLEQIVGIKLNGLILYYGINKYIFDHSTVKEQKKNFISFLQASSFNEKKGHEFSLKSFAKFIQTRKRPELYKFLIAGSGSDEQINKVKYLISILNLENNVQLLGPINQYELKKLLSEVDYFVHNSITYNFDKEGIPIAIMEAMSMGLPIVTTKHSGIPELVINGESGILVDENNIFDCADAFQKILEFKKPLQFNILRIHNVFNIDNYCRDLVNLIFRNH